MPWEPFSTNPKFQGIIAAWDSSLNEMETLRWPWLPSWLSYRIHKCHFQVELQKEKQNLSIAIHLGLSAHPAPGGLEAWAFKSLERFWTSCCPKAPGGAPNPLDVNGERVPQTFLVNLFQFASINWPCSWSGQTGDYLMEISKDVMQAQPGLSPAEDISP